MSSNSATTASPTSLATSSSASPVEVKDAVHAVVGQVDHLDDQALAREKKDEGKEEGGDAGEETHTTNRGDQLDGVPLLLPGAERRRDPRHFDEGEEQPTTPGSAADVSIALVPTLGISLSRILPGCLANRGGCPYMYF